MKIDSAHFTIFDFETTGLYPYSGDSICEVAAIRIEPGRRRPNMLQSLVDPERPISYGAFCVNGISSEMLMGKPKIEEILPRFMKFIKGSVLVAYNAGFDLGFLESALGKDKDLLEDYYVVDALRLARSLFPDIRRYNLGFVSKSLGIQSAIEHRAMADAFMTWKVFEAELAVLASRGVEIVEEIVSVQKGRTFKPRMVKDYKIELIEKAIREQKRLNIVYRSAWTSNLSKRTITPKELQRGYDKSYLIAHCHLKNAERNFRVDCIVNAKVL